MQFQHYYTAVEKLLRGIVMRRDIWPARSYVKYIKDENKFVLISEENEDCDIRELDEWKASAEDSYAVDWIEADPSKLMVVIYPSAIRVFSINNRNAFKTFDNAEVVYSDLTYKEIREALIKYLPKDKIIKTKVVFNGGVITNESNN